MQRCEVFQQLAKVKMLSVLVARLLDKVKDMRGFHHRSSHHHGNHLAFVKQSYTAPLALQCRQAIADGFCTV